MRIVNLTLEGSLTASTYLQIAEISSYFLAKKRNCAALMAAGESIYSWEYPPEAITLTIASNGGFTDGLLPAMNELKALSTEIPIIGIAFGKACSAGNMLLTACDTIVAIEGTTMGSMAGAGSYVDETEAPENLGKKAYFYTTHSGKFTGLPGENKTPEEIQAYLKASVDSSYEAIASFMETQRPGIMDEVNRLNGASFLVGVNTPSSKLFDFVASSREEVISTLEEIDMKTLKWPSLKAAMGGAKATSLAATLASEADASAKAATLTMQASEGQATMVADMKKALLEDSSFASSLAKQIAAEIANSAASVAETVKPDIIAPVASIAELEDIAKKLKASPSMVLEVAKLALPADKAALAMNSLVAAADNSKQHNQLGENGVLSSAEALGGTEAELQVAAFATNMRAAVSKLLKTA